MSGMRRGLSGSTLKMIAIVTMLVDHIGATVVLRLLMTKAQPEWMITLYQIMRDIGRIAFPIFCFLLIEGFWHTHDRRRYALRLCAFALISEIPFDLAFSGTWLEFSYQNVFFTLLIGLLTIWAMHRVRQRLEGNPLLRTAINIPIAIVGMALAWALRTDYDAKGVLCIVALYLFCDRRWQQLLAGCLAFVWFEPPAVFAFLPIALYNGQRGWKLKYLFYLFYPVHLLVLYLVCAGMGMAGIAVV